MAYTPPEYPAAIPDEVTDLPDRLDDIDWIEAARYNELKKEIVAIMTELGTDPAGSSTDVKTRLALLALIADPTFTGDATIPTIDLTGGQIKFPADVNASADANTLDDYEEGVWTAVIRGNSTAGTYEIDSQLSTYTKIGRVVHLETKITLANSVTGGGAGYIRITGLPFTKVTNTDPTGVAMFHDVVFTGSWICAEFTATTAAATLLFKEVRTDNSRISLAIGAIGADDIIWLSITYLTA